MFNYILFQSIIDRYTYTFNYTVERPIGHCCVVLSDFNCEVRGQ